MPAWISNLIQTVNQVRSWGQKSFRAESFQFSGALVLKLLLNSGHKTAALLHSPACFWKHQSLRPPTDAMFQMTSNMTEQSLTAQLCLLKGPPTHPALQHLCVITAFRFTLGRCCPLTVRPRKERVGEGKIPTKIYGDQITVQTSGLKGGLCWRSLGVD